MKTLIMVILLFLGLSLHAQDALPVEPFSGNTPTEQTTGPQKEASPFDDIPDNPDPDPVPIGNGLGVIFALSVGYIIIRYRISLRHPKK